MASPRPPPGSSVSWMSCTRQSTTPHAGLLPSRKVSVPASPMRSSKMIDGVVWDGKDPKKYAAGFKVKA